jgi:hypothetical protein
MLTVSTGLKDQPGIKVRKETPELPGRPAIKVPKGWLARQGQLDPKDLKARSAWLVRLGRLDRLAREVRVHPQDLKVIPGSRRRRPEPRLLQRRGGNDQRLLPEGGWHSPCQWHERRELRRDVWRKPRCRLPKAVVPR